MEHVVSFPVNGFITRNCVNGNNQKERSIGTFISSALIDLNDLNRIETNASNDSLVLETIKQALSSIQSKSTQLNHVVTQIYTKFIKQNGALIKINWVENHSTLIEYLNDIIPLKMSDAFRPADNANLATFLVDISLFLNKHEIINSRTTVDMVATLYGMAFLRGFAAHLKLSTKESFEVALSVLDGTTHMTKMADFLAENGNLLSLDNGKSLSTCLRAIESVYQTIPVSFQNFNIFMLKRHLLVEKDIKTRKAIEACLATCEKQIMLLIKLMQISLPYDRDEFKKSMVHPDIKQRRDLCFKIIRSFNKQTEYLNIESVAEWLRKSSKYKQNQPRIVVGRESRAFGNQAYLFANSKLIKVDDECRSLTETLKSLSSINSLKELLIVNVRSKLNLNYDELSILQVLERKFETYLDELVPSLGRLYSLVFNQHKLSSFTQYCGLFQNMREALEIFIRKSSNDVEKFRKNFVEVQMTTFDNVEAKSSIFFFNGLFDSLNSFAGKAGRLEFSLHQLEERIYTLYSQSNRAERAAFCVLLQRPSYTGSDKFKLNELESKPEQEEALQRLVRTGGDQLHMTPSYEWIVEATDLIEAVPLFIYERTVVTDGKPLTVFEVDQEGLEQTIRQIAEYCAQNIEKTMESEHIRLARSIIVGLTPELNSLVDILKQLDNTLSKEIHELLAIESSIYKQIINKECLANQIARLAQYISTLYDENAFKVEQVVENAWLNQDFITRIDALERLLNEQNIINGDMLAKASEQTLNDRLAQRAFERQRPMLAFHLLTTEAPGLIEGFISLVLEEEIAMRNILKAFGLDNQVNQFIKGVNKNMAELSECVIDEFDYESMVSQHISSGMDRQQAVLRVMSDNIPIQEQVATLAILIQMFEFSKHTEQVISFACLKIDKNMICEAETYWFDELTTHGLLNMNAVQDEAAHKVYELNQNEPDFIDLFDGMSNEAQKRKLLTYPITTIYGKEVHVNSAWIVRAKAFAYANDRYPNLYLKEKLKCFIREHTALVQTTCRRLTISENGLHDKMSDPRYAYSSGVTFESTPSQSSTSLCTSATPTGLRKRYHLIYGPSRVNLGKDERRSVENWSQFIGVSDPLAAKHAQDVYELINYTPLVRNVREAENLKVSENQWTALVRACRNVQAFFIERLGVGDIEDLSYQFNQRGGINFGSLKEGEGYNSGPTAGYCIPKDLLFKLFVATHQDTRKLTQIGIPKYLHKHLIKLMINVYSHKNDFNTLGDWELWATEQFLSKDALMKQFEDESVEISNEINNYLSRFIKLSGTQIVFHLTKLIQTLGNTGLPSPLLSMGRDLHSVLWSNWADNKITLGGEQVNRSTVFTMTREIPEAARRARSLNPKVEIAEEESLKIQMFGVYKGDDDEPPPPDVRYSWTMRAFQILSGHYQSVADSLDLEGQIIARLSWVGFKPESSDLCDIEAADYLLKKFNQENLNPENYRLLIERLKNAFPCHTSVGDITITAVPGVDSEDLLGFSAETLTLLGDEADRARQILESHANMSLEQMKANAKLRRKFPDEWTPLNRLPYKEQQRIKNLIGEAIHPLMLKLRGPGTDFMMDLQGQDLVVFSITHPEILKLDPAHLRDLMLIGRPKSALCALDFVSQGRHRCWYDRDVMLWYACARGIDHHGRLILDWSKRKQISRKSVYKAFGTGIDQYSPALGTDLRSEVIRQERRAIEIWNSSNNLIKAFEFSTKNSPNKVVSIQNELNEYKKVLVKHLSNDKLANEALVYQQYSQRLLMAKRFKPRDKIIQECIENLLVQSVELLPHKFNSIHWLSIGGMFLLNGSTELNQREILDVIRKAYHLVNYGNLKVFTEPIKSEVSLIESLIVTNLSTTRMSLNERKGEMFSVKASEDCQIRAVARRAQLLMQSNAQKNLKFRQQGYESTQTEALSFECLIQHAQKCLLNLSHTPSNGYTVEFVNETFGAIIKYTIKTLEHIIQQIFDLSQLLQESENIKKKNYILNSARNLYKDGAIDLMVFDQFCGTYEDHGFLATLLEYSHLSNSANMSQLSKSSQDILSVCELLYSVYALEKTSQYLTQSVQEAVSSSSEVWRRLCEFFAKTIDDHFYEYNPWILDSKRGSAFVHLYDELGIIKNEFKTLLYKTSWQHHRILYKYIYNLIRKHTDLSVSLYKESDIDLLLGLVELSDNDESDKILITAIGNYGVGEENLVNVENYESLWRSYNQLREIAFMRNDGFEFPIIFPSFDTEILHSNMLDKINFAILSPIGRTHYSRAIMESTYLNENIFITRTGFFSNNGGEQLSPEQVSRDRSYLFINDAHFYLSEENYMSVLEKQGTKDDAIRQVDLDKKLGRLTPKGIRIAARFNKPILIGCCIAHHHHPLEIGLTKAGYPATDKSPFLFDLTYNKSLYPLFYSSCENDEDSLLPPQIDWLQEETTTILNEQTRLGKTQLEAECVVIDSIKDRLRKFVKEYGIIIVKGAAESGARNLSRFDVKSFNKDESCDTISEEILHEATEFIYEVSKGQNVTIQKAILSTPLTWMSQSAVTKFIERQIVEHSVSVNIKQYPKDFIYATLRVIMSSGVPNMENLSDPSNWEASHLLSLSSLQTATNVGRQGTLELLAPEEIHSKFRHIFIKKLNETGRKVMCLTSKFGPKYWNDEIYLNPGGELNQSSANERYKQSNMILPFKLRRPDMDETDAIGIPYWWPRYLMLDIIPEPIFVNENGIELKNAHIIDIQSKENEDESTFIVTDKHGRLSRARIIDFKFWLLEPNVGIGLWPNYWKRELARCQEQNKTVDYRHVGVSDRTVLENFLKAGREFLKVKFKTNNIQTIQNTTDKFFSQKTSQHISNLNTPSDLALNLWTALQIVVHKYGFISIGPCQVSLWLAEGLKLTAQMKYEDVNRNTTSVYDHVLEILKFITFEDLRYSMVKMASAKKFDINENQILSWLSNETYMDRVGQLAMDILLSQQIVPSLEISPTTLSTELFFPQTKTFAIISQKTLLLTHQIYPFIFGQGDFFINIVGVHTSWIIPNSNLAKRVIVYNQQQNRFIETDLETPLILNYGYIVELYKDEEVETHSHLCQAYENVGLRLINPSNVSNVRADDKLWLRQNRPDHIKMPNYVLISRDLLNTDSCSIINSIQIFLKSCNNGVVVQPRSNTTESSHVYWFASDELADTIFETIKRIFQNIAGTDVLMSEYKGNVLYNQAPVVFRFNVSCDKVTVAAHVGKSNKKIVSLNGSASSSVEHVTQGGYCERLNVVLDSLYEQSNNTRVEISNTNWNHLLNIAKSVANCTNLPLVGIDMVLEIDENDSNNIYPYVLEVNARPGTLIFGEQAIFNETGSKIKQSVLSAPVNESFWNHVTTELSSNRFCDKKWPETLLEWKNFLSSERMVKIIKTPLIHNGAPESNCSKLLGLLKARYDTKDTNILIDRINCLAKTIDDSINASFDVNQPIKILFVNGRDRYFGGHTDFIGLGGPTINATTENEIITIIQETASNKSNDITIHASNSSVAYKSEVFYVSELLNVLNKIEAKTLKLGQPIWNSNDWTSYLKGSLAYMLSENFKNVKSKLKSLRIHFNSSGQLNLQSRIGSSSSSALTSSFVLGLNELFKANLDRTHLSQTDYGEFFLGKTAGCADKTTILNAVNNKLILVTSIPEQFAKSISLPKQIVVIMANSNVPRLNSPYTRDYLLKRSFDLKKIDSIIAWANSIMNSFGSYVFVSSVNTLIGGLKDDSRCEKVGITKQEAELVLNVFIANKALNDNPDAKEIGFNTDNRALLRELCTGGRLDDHFGYENRHSRFNLIFRLLKLLPHTERVRISDDTNENVIYPRKATLYGLSEIERCYEYVRLMEEINKTNENEINYNYMNSLLDLVRWSHNGDRATVDYRNDFKPTSWCINGKNILSDDILNAWIAAKNEDLFDKSGGFERSLPEFDEWADELDLEFNKQAALRVSAAGLGGTVCIHSMGHIVDDVMAWLNSKGLEARIVRPGPSYLIV